VIAVSRDVITQTFHVLSTCGGGARECVAYWTGTTDNDFVDCVEHPLHSSSEGGYSVEDRWLTGFWRSLGQLRRSIKAQIHTHPAAAFHSAIDDDWPIVSQCGFVSIVIPNFALGAVSLDNAWIGRLRADGKWEQLQSAADVLQLL
jgi:hypothetical protein